MANRKAISHMRWNAWLYKNAGESGAMRMVASIVVYLAPLLCCQHARSAESLQTVAETPIGVDEGRLETHASSEQRRFRFIPSAGHSYLVEIAPQRINLILAL